MVEFKALGKYVKMWRARDSGERGVKAHLEGPRNYLEIGENKLVLPSRGEPGIGKEVGRVLENLGKERTVCKKKMDLGLSLLQSIDFLSHRLPENSVVQSKITIFKQTLLPFVNEQSLRKASIFPNI